jgi:hypothetical protein
LKIIKKFLFFFSINGHKIINYSGERKKEEIIQFLSKVDAPHVTKLTNLDQFESCKLKYNHFFILLESQNDTQSKIIVNNTMLRINKKIIN